MKQSILIFFIFLTLTSVGQSLDNKNTILLPTSTEALNDAARLDSLIKVVNNLNADKNSDFVYSIKSVYFGKRKKGDTMNTTPEIIREANLYPWTFEVTKTLKKKAN
jgi:hypothetical protein